VKTSNRPITNPTTNVQPSTSSIYSIATAAPKIPKATPAALTTAFAGAAAVDGTAAEDEDEDPEVAALAAVPVAEPVAEALVEPPEPVVTTNESVNAIPLHMWKAMIHL
jgi:hypothetical protein